MLPPSPPFYELPSSPPIIEAKHISKRQKPPPILGNMEGSKPIVASGSKTKNQTEIVERFKLPNIPNTTTGINAQKGTKKVKKNVAAKNMKAVGNSGINGQNPTEELEISRNLINGKPTAASGVTVELPFRWFEDPPAPKIPKTVFKNFGELTKELNLPVVQNTVGNFGLIRQKASKKAENPRNPSPPIGTYARPILINSGHSPLPSRQNNLIVVSKNPPLQHKVSLDANFFPFTPRTEPRMDYITRVSQWIDSVPCFILPPVSHPIERNFFLSGCLPSMGDPEDEEGVDYLPEEFTVTDSKFSDYIAIQNEQALLVTRMFLREYRDDPEQIAKGFITTSSDPLCFHLLMNNEVNRLWNEYIIRSYIGN